MKKLLIVLFLFLVSCAPSKEQVELRKAHKEAHKKNYFKAINKYFFVSKKFPGTKESIEATKKAANYSFLNQRDYVSALYFLKKLVVVSANNKEKIEAQRQIAEIQFQHLKNCDEAILEYKKLLMMEKDAHYKFISVRNIAHCYSNIGEFKQALTELKAVKETELSQKDKYLFYIDTANYLENIDNLDAAHKVYIKINEEFPILYREESLGLKVAVLFEEEKKFSKAIEVLRRIRSTYPQPDFIDLKIESLKRRRKYLPEG